MEKDSGVFFHMVCPEDAVWADSCGLDLHPALTVALSTSESPPRASTLGPGGRQDSCGLAAVSLQRPPPSPQGKHT